MSDHLLNFSNCLITPKIIPLFTARFRNFIILLYFYLGYDCIFNWTQYVDWASSYSLLDIIYTTINMRSLIVCLLVANFILLFDF